MAQITSDNVDVEIARGMLDAFRRDSVERLTNIGIAAIKPRIVAEAEASVRDLQSRTEMMKNVFAHRPEIVIKLILQHPDGMKS